MGGIVRCGGAKIEGPGQKSRGTERGGDCSPKWRGTERERGEQTEIEGHREKWGGGKGGMERN